MRDKNSDDQQTKIQEEKWKSNVGKIDRSLRIIVGALLVGGNFFNYYVLGNPYICLGQYRLDTVADRRIFFLPGLFTLSSQYAKKGAGNE
jgi:hypothetical protein